MSQPDKPCKPNRYPRSVQEIQERFPQYVGRMGMLVPAILEKANDDKHIAVRATRTTADYIAHSGERTNFVSVTSCNPQDILRDFTHRDNYLTCHRIEIDAPLDPRVALNAQRLRIILHDPGQTERHFGYDIAAYTPVGPTRHDEDLRYMPETGWKLHFKDNQVAASFLLRQHPENRQQPYTIRAITQRGRDAGLGLQTQTHLDGPISLIEKAYDGCHAPRHGYDEAQNYPHLTRGEQDILNLPDAAGVCALPNSQLLRCLGGISAVAGYNYQDPLGLLVPAAAIQEDP